jgi:hypothetical protein
MVAVQGQQGATYVPRPPRVQDVGNAIGWSVAMTAFDFGYLLELADYLASSTSARHSEKYVGGTGPTAAVVAVAFGLECFPLPPTHLEPTPPAQERAVRLTGILFRNTDTRFRRTS